MNIKCFIVEQVDPDQPLAADEVPLWRNVETGQLYENRNLPPGAMWRATWFEDYRAWRGHDGESWVVMTPGGEWSIDSQASNCTKPEDDFHKCWCRHGVAPNFTVNKEGNTCSAGAGSILVGDYHGFLINGELVSC